MNESYESLINAYYQKRDDEAGLGMAKYLKNQFLCLGIKRPERTAIQKEFMKQWKKDKLMDWDLVDYLWELPEREFQYLAIDLLVALKEELQYEDIQKVEHLIITKSWWDTVDIIATKAVGTLCIENPTLIDQWIMGWSMSDNIWLARTAILFQLKYKERTDVILLGQIIDSNLGSNEFFTNKAIGWALREYSKTNPDWVRAFIESHTLHSLSIREGSKYLL